MFVYERERDICVYLKDQERFKVVFVLDRESEIVCLREVEQRRFSESKKVSYFCI